MFKNKKVVWITAILVLILAGLIYLKIKDRGVPSIRVAEINVGPIESIISATGMVKAPIYELSSKGGNKIDEILVKEGQKVNQGQLLVKFDTYNEAKKNFDRTYSLFNNGLASDQAFDSSKTILDSARIISPGNGIVAKINYDLGEIPTPGSPVIIIVDEDSSWIEAQIDEIDMGKVKLGQTAEVTSDVYPDKKFLASLYWIAPLAELRKVGERVKMDEESYIFMAKLKFIGPHQELKTNMSVNVDILTSSKAKALIVPREAIFSDDDTNYVYKIKSGRAYKNKIVGGIRSYTSVEALSGVDATDLVAISKLKEIKDKGRVKIEN